MNNTLYTNNTDPKTKDTSMPGREEEVIVNQQEQTRVINTDDTHGEDEGELRYNEGLENNNVTEPVVKEN